MSSEGDPPRLGSEGERGGLLRGAIEEARRDRPTEAQLRSLAAGVSARIGQPLDVPVEGGPAGTVSPPAPATGAWAGVGTKLGVALLLAAGGAGIWHLAEPTGTTAPAAPGPTATPSAPAPSTVGAPPASAPGSGPASGPGPGAAPAPRSAPRAIDGAGSASSSVPGPAAIPGTPPRGATTRPVPTAAPPSVPAAPSASASVTAVPPRSELAILRDAQAALGRDPAAALLLVAEHERAWPAGALTQEREVLAVEGLVRLGRGPEARSRADAFGRRFPASPYRRRLEVVLDPANARAPAGGVDADHR